MNRLTRVNPPGRVQRVFVYEYLSGGGLKGAGHEAEGGDELLRMGLSMRDAMVADVLQLGDCAITVATARGAAQTVESAPAVGPRPKETPAAFVKRMALRHDLSWIVAPESDGILTQLCCAVAPARWIGCTAEAVELASAKQATLVHLAGHGVSTPLMFDGLPETRRWVVKPDDGAGAVATRVHQRFEAAAADLALRHAAGRSATLEPWVEGEALSLSMLCGARGMKLLSLNRQHLLIDEAGMASFEGVSVNVAPPADPRWPALRTVAKQVAQAMPGLRGFVGIDLVWHATRGPIVIEVNPRVTCAYVGLSQSLSRNLAAEIIATHLADVAAEAPSETVHAKP